MTGMAQVPPQYRHRGQRAIRLRQKTAAQSMKLGHFIESGRALDTNGGRRTE
jgi:hypothetical protein